VTRRNGRWRHAALATAPISLLALLAVLFSTPSPSAAAPDDTTWAAPVKLSAGLPDGWWPELAVDHRGVVHAVWHGSFPDRSTYVSGLFYSQKTAAGWSTPTDVALISAGGGAPALRASIAIDAADRVHLIRRGIGRIDPQNVLEEYLWHTATAPVDPNKVTSWDPPVRISRGITGNTYYSIIGFDSTGKAYVLWTEDDGSGKGKWSIYARTSVDGGRTWSQHSILDTDNPVWWYRFQFVIDGKDRLHAAWEIADPDTFGVSTGFVYATSEDGAKSWTRVSFDQQTEASVGGSKPQQPAIGVDGSGNVLLVYREQESDKIVYRKSSDGTTWSQPEPLPGVRAGVRRPYDQYGMATDSAGRVHLIVVAYRDNSDRMELLHLRWDGTKWEEPDAIGNAPDFPEYPRIAIGRGNELHVVWFAGDRPTVDRVPTGVWYSSRRTDAPVIPDRPATVLAQATPVRVATTVGAKPTAPDPASSQIARVTPVGGTTADQTPPPSGLREQPLFAVLVGVTPVLLLVAFVSIAKLTRAQGLNR